MGTFNLSIKTDNEAFRGGNGASEVARIMRDIATSIERGDNEPSVKDINGNTVGEVEYIMGDSEIQLEQRTLTVEQLDLASEDVQNLLECIKECDVIVSISESTFDEKAEALYDKESYINDIAGIQGDLNEDSMTFPTGIAIVVATDGNEEIINSLVSTLSQINKAKEELLELQSDCGMEY